MPAITGPIPVDTAAFNKVVFFSSEPAMAWDQDEGAPSETEQAKDDDGRALYTVRLAVEYTGAFGRSVAEIVELRTTEQRGEDPAKTCSGKPIRIDGLTVSNQVRTTSAGNSFLQQRWYAESVGPVSANHATTATTQVKA
ncbi:hypothetical protein ACIGKQ_17105 [Gordonia sp. NPDC062954]|uniref:hypothetical protein n=1 Tax=Gordonia sp. NPDC062954 TaxID=3364003 RepID=UPI0037C7B631